MAGGAKEIFRGQVRWIERRRSVAGGWRGGGVWRVSQYPTICPAVWLRVSGARTGSEALSCRGAEGAESEEEEEDEDKDGASREKQPELMRRTYMWLGATRRGARRS